MNFWYILQNLYKVAFNRFLAPSLKLHLDAPKCIKKPVPNFLTLPNSSNAVKFSGKWANIFGGYELTIVTTYSDIVPQKVIQWIKTHIARDLEIT